MKSLVEVAQEALEELGQYSSDQIAEKLSAGGLLWCDEGGAWRSFSCPIHHYLTERLSQFGLSTSFLVIGSRSTTISNENSQCQVVFIRPPEDIDIRLIDNPASVAIFVDRYDSGDFKHLENETPS